MIILAQPVYESCSFGKLVLSDSASLPEHHWLFWLCSLNRNHIWYFSVWYCLCRFTVTKNVTFHFLPSSCFLLGSLVFFLLFWTRTLYDHYPLFGSSTSWEWSHCIELLIEFRTKCIPKFLSVTIAKTYGIRLMDWFYCFWSWSNVCFFFTLSTASSERPIFRHICHLISAVKNTSFISTGEVLGSECNPYLMLSL